MLALDMTFNSAPTTLLQVSELALQRGDAWLFKNLSFHVSSGQILWLRGQNGRGKTSLLRVLVGLAQPERGTLAWSNSNLANESFSKAVYIGHANGLKDELTVLESLQFLARVHGHTLTQTMALTALRHLHIAHCCNRLVRTLSQGQQRRVALARLALETTPNLWVLDEPFDTLDAEGVRIVNHLLSEHLARQGSIVLTSHIPLELMNTKVQQLNLDEVNR
jgi:heme exporter protein A